MARALDPDMLALGRLTLRAMEKDSSVRPRIVARLLGVSASTLERYVKRAMKEKNRPHHGEESRPTLQQIMDQQQQKGEESRPTLQQIIDQQQHEEESQPTLQQAADDQQQGEKEQPTMHQEKLGDQQQPGEEESDRSILQEKPDNEQEQPLANP